jgi:xanthine dehydrogenase accessory factor
MNQFEKKFADRLQSSTPFVLVTVVGTEGAAPREVGAKMVVGPTGLEFGTIGGGTLEATAILEAALVLIENRPLKKRLSLGPDTGQCCGGVVELFYEIYLKSPKLYLFGAGHVGQALCQTLIGTPFDIICVDKRPEWNHAGLLPASVKNWVGDFDFFLEQMEFDRELSYFVIMTYDHDLDQKILEEILIRDFHFLGLIGSAQKWHRFKQRLEKKGYSSEQLSAVHCPIGIPNGGKSPQEVAISIAQQLLQQHHGCLNEKTELAEFKNHDPLSSGPELADGTTEGITFHLP